MVHIPSKIPRSCLHRYQTKSPQLNHPHKPLTTPPTTLLDHPRTPFYHIDPPPSPYRSSLFAPLHSYHSRSLTCLVEGLPCPSLIDTEESTSLSAECRIAANKLLLSSFAGLGNAVFRSVGPVDRYDDVDRPGRAGDIAM